MMLPDRDLMEKPVRVRIAPSPTGPLHVGTARTALHNILFARAHGGVTVLRIEDTDRERSREEYTDGILRDLRWLGLHWEEGPDVGGPHEPYRQSERTARYRAAVENLLKQGSAYRCFCTAERLDTLRAAGEERHEPFRYDGTCRDLPPGVSVQRADSGEPFVVRLRVDGEEPITVQDSIRGRVTFPPAALDDFVIGKGMDAPLFHLAVVVDDAEMEITHVIRGEDHLSNTPKHILLQEALGLPTPQYAHLPLILDAQRRKLSKRSNTAVTVAEYRDAGFLPHALLNTLALVGWNPKTPDEVLTFDEMLQHFRLEHVQKGGAVFSAERLEWLNRQHLRRLPPEQILTCAKPFLREQNVPDAQAIRIIAVERERIHTLKELPAALDVLKKPPLDAAALPWKGDAPDVAAQGLARIEHTLEALPAESWHDARALSDELLRAADAAGQGRASVLWPVRYALCGKTKSPGPGELLWILGKEESLQRLRTARSMLGASA
jgi:glutamyl-tRNA synthetase